MALRKFALDATALTIARIFQAAANVIALPVLARFLTPSDFGLVAAANSILFLTSMLADAGFGNSLIRTSANERTVWSSVIWVIASWSAGLAFLLVAISIPFGWLLKEPEVAPLIAALAVLPLGQGLLAVPIADLQQRHRFGWISAADVVGSAAGVTAAIVFAIAGAGPWALVAQPLTYLIVKAAVVSGSTRFRPSFLFDRHLIGEHLNFARNTGAFAIVHFFNAQMDNVMIARFAGTGPLGLYSMAYRIMGLPSILGTANNALYPRLVKLQNDKGALRQLVLVATTGLSILIFPPMAVLCAASTSVFTVLFSDRWDEAATVYSYLAPVGAFQAVSGIYALVLMALGRTDIRLRMAMEFVILWMVVLVCVVQFGIQAVAM